MLAAAIDALRSLLKIFLPGIGNIHVLLWIAIDQRKPRTLDLHHNAMAAAESVIDAGQNEADCGGLIRLKRLRLFKAVSKFRTERLASNQLLIPAHMHFFEIR